MVEAVDCPCGESHTQDEWRVLGMVCGRCKTHTGNNNQGHYWAICKVLLNQGKSVNDSVRPHHFCCPDDCELPTPAQKPKRSCDEVHPQYDIYHPEGH